MPEVIVADREHMNLLGLFLASLLEQRLAQPARSRQLQGLRGPIVVRSGKMAVTLHVTNGAVVCQRGADPKARAIVNGDLDTLLRLGLGQLPLVALVSRRLRLGGNVLALWRLWGLLRPRSRNEPH
ncbi:MAG: SCP2 sterol-binding domain-containing protein [Deinococcus sp.]|nr:SCP2 sterol-binding domain-containing protein [Deinococcus sp.]